MLSHALCCVGVVPGCGIDDASDFDGYRIKGYPAGGGTGRSGHSGAMARRDAVPRDFDSVASPQRGS